MARRTFWALVVFCAECALLARAQAAGGGKLDLLDHFGRFQRTATLQFTGYLDIPDSTGTHWDFDARGAINDGLSDCFDGGMILSVNGMQFASQQGAVGADSNIMLYADLGGGLRMSRYIHVDVATGTCVFVDSVENVNGQTARVSLALYSDHGTQQLTYVSNLGAATPVQFAKGEGGLHTVHHPGRTSVIYALCAPRSKLKPTMMWQNLEYPTFTYELEIPPGKTCSVMSLLQQRVSTGTIPTSDQLEDVFDPLFDRHWLTKLPAELRRTIVNWGGTGGGDLGAASAGALLQPVLDLADEFGLEASPQARLVLAEDAALSGQVAGGSLLVQSACGPVEVAWEEVALVIGGAGQGRTMRVYLKNGEIYVGEIAAEGLQFRTDSGLEIALEPAQLNYLFAPLLPGEGLPPATATLLVELRSGDRMFIAPSDAALTCFTAWGPVEVAVSEIRDLAYTREPQPGYSVQFQNLSRVHALLADAPLVLSPLRIATLETSVQQIARLTSVQAFQATTDDEASPAAKQATYFELAGGMLLVGGFAGPLEVQTASGAAPLDPALVATVEVAEPARLGSGPLLQITLKDGGTLTGRLAGRMLEIAAGERTWRIPLEYLLAYRTPEPSDPSDDSRSSSEAYPAEDQRPIENRLDESYEFFDEGPDGSAPEAVPAAPGDPTAPPGFDSPFEEPVPQDAEPAVEEPVGQEPAAEAAPAP